ncbi:MAG: NAD(P)H-hydrate epimerase, partial [Mucilaginibacter sp.]|uniref:NAD(P)H-hydrate epimerase n=1 Tax=Mucilaginibacter sp. TaxID=1882438 RepID=UPI00319F39B3
MLPLLTAQQIRETDAYTIKHEPIPSIQLMERASRAFVSWFVNHFPDKLQAITIYCGTGNNGGDGLAIACMLYEHKYTNLEVRVARFSEKSTADFDSNFERLKDNGLDLRELKPERDFPEDKSDIVIDALLGSGLNKPLEGDYKRLADFINELHKTVVAVDVPTGFYTDGEIDKNATVIKANLVITFQQPKINFLLPESAAHMDCWEVVNIGLDEGFIRSLDSPYQLIEEKDIRQILKPRRRFSHKGTYGHALIVAGQEKTMGAALLSASASVYAGAGLTTACIPESGLTALNTAHAEVMAIVRPTGQLPEINWEQYSTIGIGPGLGKDDDAHMLVKHILDIYNKPVLVDADGLNLLATHPGLWDKLPKGSILTPHMKEFDRLFGDSANWWQRLQMGIKKAAQHHVYIILKNDYTMVI